MSATTLSRTRRFVVGLLALGIIASGLFITSPAASAAAGNATLNPGETLEREQSIRSANGYEFVMQTDGNAVIYKPTPTGRTAIWATNTSGRSGTWLAMQGDGNLVLYDHGQPYWASGMKGAGSYLVMQDDGNLVMYRPSDSGRTAVWASDTGQTTTPPPPSGGCGSLEMWLLRDPARSTTDMRLRVREVTSACTVTERIYRAGSGNGGKADCTTNNWLPAGDWVIGNNRGGDVRGFYQNGVGTLAGRSHFDLTMVSTPLSCSRPRQAPGTFAVHSDAGVRVPSAQSSANYTSNGCVKLSGTDLTDLYNHWAGRSSLGEGTIKLHVVNTSALPAVSGWRVLSSGAF